MKLNCLTAIVIFTTSALLAGCDIEDLHLPDRDDFCEQPDNSICDGKEPGDKVYTTTSEGFICEWTCRSPEPVEPQAPDWTELPVGEGKL